MHESKEVKGYEVVIGIDWADEKNDLWIMDKKRAQGEHRQVAQDAVALHQFAQQIKERYGGKRIALVVDQKRGGLINFLLGLDFVDLYPVHAARAKDYRRALYPSGAKSDPVDARIHAEFFCKHPERFGPPLKADSAPTRELQWLCEDRRGFVDQQTRLEQRLRSCLKQYNPLILKLFDDLGRTMCLRFILRWPSLPKVQRASTQVLRKFFYSHNSRSAAKIQQRLELIRTERALSEEAALLSACSRKAQTLARQLLALGPQIKAYDGRIKELFEAHPDAPVFRSVPGAGAALGPRLLCAFGTDRSRFKSAQNMAQWNGSAPVSINSGQDKRTGQSKRRVRWRWSAPTFVRQSFVEHAQHSIGYCRWASAYYESKKEQGKTRQTILRSLAFKWTRILYRCWQTGDCYEEQRYLDSLRRRNSPLWQRLERIQGHAG